MRKYNILWFSCMFIYTFYIIYRPNLSPWIGNINLLYILTIGAYFVLFFKHRAKVKKVLQYKFSSVLLIYLVLSLIYLVLITTLQGNTIIGNYGINTMIHLIFILLPNILLISIEFQSRNYNNIDFFKFILNIGLFQSVIVILMILFPLLREIAMESFMASVSDKTPQIFLYRIYGISSDYTFSMQMFQGFLVGFAMLLSVNVSKKYYIYVPFLILSSVLNGRSGIIISLVAIIVVFFVISVKKRDFLFLFKIFLTFIITFGLLILGMNIIKSFSQNTYEWIMRFVDETSNLFNGDVAGGTYGALLNDMLFFPKGIDLIAGTSYRIFGGREIDYLISDIGYVNDVFIGGIILLILFYIPLIYFLLSNIKSSDLNLGIGLFCVLFLLIANFKGEIFRPNVLMYGVILLKFNSVLLHSKYNK